MNIALIVPFWDSVVQRPHHWEKQARRHHHSVTVYALDQGRDTKRSATTDGSTRVLRLPVSLVEKVLSRARLPVLASTRMHQRWSRFISGETMVSNQYDAAIYAGPPFLTWRKLGSQIVLVYDCMDEWTAFRDAPPKLGAMEAELAREADIILSVSPVLQARMSREFAGKRTLLVPNACDFEFFAQAAQIKRVKPVKIGYVGTIGSWFDWNLVRAVANAQPNIQVEIVGPLLNIPLPTDLPPNVHYLDRRPYDQMPRIIASFSVGIIPFDIGSKLVDAVSPIKLYEYLAAGKPVVSTPMPDVLKLAEHGVVHSASSTEDFVEAVRQAQLCSDSLEHQERRQSVARAHSWQARWQLIESQISECRIGTVPLSAMLAAAE